MMIKVGKVYRIVAANGKTRAIARAGSGPENTLVFTPVPKGTAYELEGEVQL